MPKNEYKMAVNLKVPFFEVMEPPILKNHKKPQVNHSMGKNESIVDMFGSI